MSAADDLPIRFGPDGLVPVAVQDAESGAVLMLAFMNREALEATRATGEAHYWSRSRNALWHKGATSSRPGPTRSRSTPAPSPTPAC